MWEYIEETYSYIQSNQYSKQTERLRVPGGWIIKVTVVSITGVSIPIINMVFISDPTWEWKVV